MAGYKGLTKNEKMLLLETDRDFFHLLESLGKNENIKKFLNVWLLGDPIQTIETSTCGPFQLYFYEDFFFFRRKQQTTYLQKTDKPSN